MGYYLPYHDYGSAQYVNRIHRKKQPNQLVLAPVKISKTKIVKRDDPMRYGVNPINDTSIRKRKQIAITNDVQQKILLNIEGKGKYINESI
ncbi:MAG TPA: hypothetical protein VNM69_16850 [Bacillus sp. (in: firmicutes)]|uniref:hypothetical protein n=1 Tax=Bacillus litorisediminis TaxID=2922713 RepID=UPI001FAC74D9|nr:hypothetical protein [Bacillus litorisediminis]HWO77536.1 hypothetical protein [Bacillus sp. (in: firmicutes)]